MQNQDKIILDLCEGTGAATEHYRRAGYEVKGIDIRKGQDVRLHIPIKERVYGIWASPDCTDLAGSGARWWKEKGDKALLDALALADACMRVILLYDLRDNLKWWCLENPVGRLWRFYRVSKKRKMPRFYQPCNFGDPWTKRTGLVGRFNWPVECPVEPTEGSKIHLYPPSKDRAMLRSIISPRFAQAFFEANR